MEQIKVVEIIKIFERKIWIESDFLGSKHVMIQHADGESKPFTYCSFFYDHRHTGNSTIWSAATAMAIALGAKEPVDIRSRDIPENFFKAASNRDEWKLYPNEKPDDNQNIAFVVKSTNTPHLNGKVLGGFYNENTENFSTPGVGFDATYWRPMFEAPDAAAST